MVFLMHNSTHSLIITQISYLKKSQISHIPVIISLILYYVTINTIILHGARDTTQKVQWNPAPTTRLSASVNCRVLLLFAGGVVLAAMTAPRDTPRGPLRLCNGVTI